MSIDAQKVMELLDKANFVVRDIQDIPPSLAELRPVPACLHLSVADRLRRTYPHGLYSHQAGAIEEAVKGADVVLASATASGKSLPFMSVAAHLAIQNPACRVLALYPARALIQDQLTKWREFLLPLDVSFTYIDGGVPVADRAGRIAHAQVAVMTPDVAHAWLMSHLHEAAVRDFLRHLRLLVASIYEETGKPPKGILVVNTWRDKPLDERTDEDFPVQMLQYSRQCNHCLVTGLQLFVIRAEVEKDSDRAEYWRKQLLTTTGRLSGGVFF